ncbi:hypothetical protein [Spongorhabdus nitratireducens]
MTDKNWIGLQWWRIANFRLVGVQKLPLWHALAYSIVAILTWSSISFVFALPKLQAKEFGDSLALGFVFTFYGFIFFTYSCLKDSYQVIKANNLARYPIVWLGCWSIIGLKLFLFIIIPLIIITALSSKLFPYNHEDIVFISNCILLFGIHISYTSIEQTFSIKKTEDIINQQAEGVADNA